MKARWKWIVAVSIVGIACFLIWAVVSTPAHVVAIQFLGYRTNGVEQLTLVPPTNCMDVAGRFCLTNGSRRSIYCHTVGGNPACRVETKASGEWRPDPKAFRSGSSVGGLVCLPPAHAIRFSLNDLDVSQPLRVIVSYNTNEWAALFGVLSASMPKPAAPSLFTTIKNRVSTWLHWKHDETSASITIQE